MAISKKSFFPFFALLILSINVYSTSKFNRPNPDSLLRKARIAPDVKTRLRLAKQAIITAQNFKDNVAVIKGLDIIADLFEDDRNYDSVRIYANKALLVAETNNLDSLKGNPYLYLGNASFGEGNLVRAIGEFETAASFYQKSNQLSNFSTANLNIGICKRKLSQYSSAISYFLKSAANFERLKDNESLSYTYNSTALCFVELTNYPKAIFYNKAALAIRQQLKDSGLISETLNNMGYAFLKYKKPDSAIYYLSKSFEIRKHEKDSSIMILTLQNLGASWLAKRELNKAERYILRSLAIAKKYAMSEEIARGHSDLAEVYTKQKRYEEALASINTAIDTVKRLKLPELLLEDYAIKYDTYNQMGDYKNAILYLNKKTQLKDSLFNIQKNRQVEEIEIQYQTNQKEEALKAQQKILKQQRTSITILIISAALLIVLFAITYINFRAKQKANLRIQTLMRDLHHRVKNNLQILSGLFTMQIENLNDETTKNALRENEARLTSMNLIHNKLYLNNTTTKIEMSDYLTNLLTHIRDSFGSQKQNMIDLRIEVSNVMLEADKAVAIGLIANELATNAFKYAFNDQGGEIYLALKFVEKSKLLLTLCDNGIGIDDEKNKNKPPSFGLRLVNLMARQLNSTLVVTHNPGVSYQMEISV